MAGELILIVEDREPQARAGYPPGQGLPDYRDLRRPKKGLSSPSKNIPPSS